MRFSRHVYWSWLPFPSPISDECCLSTKTQEVLPAATQEVTNSTTGEELQAQVESLVHPVANSEPPVTTRKEHPPQLEMSLHDTTREKAPTTREDLSLRS